MVGRLRRYEDIEKRKRADQDGGDPDDDDGHALQLLVDILKGCATLDRWVIGKGGRGYLEVNC